MENNYCKIVLFIMNNMKHTKGIILIYIQWIKWTNVTEVLI